MEAFVPYGKLSSAADVGKAIRFRRKELLATQEKAAALSGVGTRFLSELERGKPTVEIEKAFKVLTRLGLELWIKPRS